MATKKKAAKKSASPRSRATATKANSQNNEVARNRVNIEDLKGKEFYLTNSPGEAVSTVTEVHEDHAVFTTEGKEGNAVKMFGTVVFE